MRKLKVCLLHFFFQIATFLKTGIYIYIHIYVNILRGKKDATTFSRQACFVNRFTLQGFNERIFM